jgi:nitroimidazol reductase NimA-like FMN-containing flavoprotein (pyridoxamine 5'-phosphate oxidase superfamily)
MVLSVELATVMDESGGPLNSAELAEFLAQPLLLKLACVRPDGWPYVVPLWYAWHEGKFFVVGRERAVWVAYLRREPRVGVLIDEEARRHRRVQMTATARVVEGPVRRADGSERWHQIDKLLVARYMADEPGRAYAQLTAERPRFLIEITPAQITSWAGGAWHRRYVTSAPSTAPPTAVFAN